MTDAEIDALWIAHCASGDMRAFGRAVADAAERAALAAPQGEPVRLQCTTCGTVYADGVPPAAPQGKAVQQWRLRGAILWSDDHPVSNSGPLDYETRVLWTAPTAPPAAPQGEPVAFLYQHTRTQEVRVLMPGQIPDAPWQWVLACPLYTTPPAAPSDEEKK
jgi:hypothetical protein